MSAIKQLSIRGFKSIRTMESLELSNLNVLVGANGVGKSNFISFFSLLSELIDRRLKVWTSKHGGADKVLSFGAKETSLLEFRVRFDLNGYDVELAPTADSGFTFVQERLYFDGPYFGVTRPELGSGHNESKLKESVDSGSPNSIASYCFSAISSWRVFHFHDTSDTASVKRQSTAHDNEYLRGDAANLAAFLLRVKNEDISVYQQIIKTIRLAIPFFDDFVLKPSTLDSGEQQIRLLWRQIDSDYPMWPSQLSDGSLRFICLVAALLQPTAPSTIIIDEPELGMHPYAVTLLGALLRSASERMQVIVSTQSVSLLNEFSIDDIIVVERKDGASVFNRLSENEFSQWLEDYSLGELWEKNIFGGRPSK